MTLRRFCCLASQTLAYDAPKDGMAARRQPLLGLQQPEQMYRTPPASKAGPSTLHRHEKDNGRGGSGGFFTHGVTFSPLESPWGCHGQQCAQSRQVELAPASVKAAQDSAKLREAGAEQAQRQLHTCKGAEQRSDKLLV